jgi:hypothetical protein
VLLKAAALLAAVAALAGCGGSSKEAAPTTTAPASTLPPGCSVSDVDRIVTSFLARPQLAPPAFFELYAAYDSDGRKFISKKRAVALAHLRGPGARGERCGSRSRTSTTCGSRSASRGLHPTSAAAASTRGSRRVGARSTAPTGSLQPG